jgi:hypothetical protein
MDALGKGIDYSAAVIDEDIDMSQTPRKATAPAKGVKKAAKPAAKSVPKVRRPRGRPSTYDPRTAMTICARLSEGESLRQICSDKAMPNRATIYEWLFRHEDFADHYARAREEQADTLADEIQAIVDEIPAETVDQHGVARLDSAYVNWMRLRVDARKWVAAKLKPRKYGEKLALGGDADAPPIKTEDTGSAKLFDLIRGMESRKRVAE